MVLEVIEVEFDFYMLPEFEAEAIDLWGKKNLDTKLQEIGDALYKADHIGGDVWKVRIGAKGKGKRGGARVIYVQLLDERAVLLIDLYSKSDKEDLSAAEEKEFKQLAENLSLKGVKGHVKGKAKHIKGKIKKRGGVRKRRAGTKASQGKGKSSRRKKD